MSVKISSHIVALDGEKPDVYHHDRKLEEDRAPPLLL
jgi:hypothetical protein